MSIKINLNSSGENETGPVLPTGGALANAVSATGQIGVDSYSTRAPAKDEKKLFSLLEFFPVMGFFFGPSRAGFEELSMDELYKRAEALSRNVKSKRNLGFDQYAGMRLEQLEAEIEIVFRHFSKAASLLNANETENEQVSASREIEKGAFLMESMVTEFSAASKVLAIQFGMEAVNERPKMNWGRNVIEFSKAVVDFLVYVSNVSHCEIVFLISKGNIGTLLSVLDSVPDVERLGAVEYVLAKYSDHFDTALVERMLMLTAREKLNVTQEAIFEFIKGELRAEGLPERIIEARLSEDRENFKKILSGRTNSDGGSNLFNDGTLSEPAFMFYSEALWRAIELEPFYAKLMESKTPFFGQLPILHAPVVKFRRRSSGGEGPLSQTLGEAFHHRNEVFMEGLAKLREDLRAVRRRTVERVEKK